jgi:hypothetical protein
MDYQDFTARIVVQPGKMEVVRIAMEKAPTGPLLDVTATVKIAFNPSSPERITPASFWPGMVKNRR